MKIDSLARGVISVCGSQQSDNSIGSGDQDGDASREQQTTVAHLTLEELDARISERAAEIVRRDREEMRLLMMQNQQEMEAKVDAIIAAVQGNIQAEEMAPLPDLEDPSIEIPYSNQQQKNEAKQPICSAEFRPKRLSISRKSDAGDQEFHELFGESVYTLIYLKKIWSQSFWYAMFIIALQVFITLLTLVDVASDPIPAMVSPAVTLAQGSMILMLIPFMPDLIEAVLKIRDGFHPEIQDKHPGATYYNWVFSCYAQLGASFLLLVASFYLTMNTDTDTVIELMLNVTALFFMAEIDDLGFKMAKHGFITNKLRRDTLSVLGVKVKKRKRKGSNHRILFFGSLVGLMAGYGILKYQQLTGYSLPTNLYVQFGGAYNSKIPYYSGILTSEKALTIRHRVYSDMGTQQIKLSYCLPKKAWTFYEESDPCDYFAKSYETETYDVTTLHDAEWEIKDKNDKLTPFDTFSMVTKDCNPDACQGTCGKDGLCECPHDRFGLDCEFANVCPEIILDGRFGDFPTFKGKVPGSKITVDVDKKLELLKDNRTNTFVRVYNMPVYYGAESEQATVIFFSGRRWVITKDWDLLNATLRERRDRKRFPPEQTAALLSTEFHAYHKASYEPLFFSEAVDFETPNFQPTPTGLEWWYARALNYTARDYVPGSSVDPMFVCNTCLAGQGGFCGAHGSCNLTTGVCDCKEDYVGTKCEEQMPCYQQEWPCFGDGICDHVSGVCRCNPPFYGKLCDAYTECNEEEGYCWNGGACMEEEEPCLNGWVCNTNAVKYQCQCPSDPALGGISCEKYADCHIYGCANGGVCGPSGKCICRPPFGGVLCNLVNQTQEDFLCPEDTLCMNGVCNATSGTCICNNPNSYGALCELQYDCNWGGCLNSGTCNETSGVCDCPEPYSGPDCAVEPICSEDSYCEKYYGTGSICDTQKGVCKCGDSVYDVGKKCATCKTEGCHNGGVCNVRGYCECPTPYTGFYCDYLAQDLGVGMLEDIMEKTVACVEEYGFPPYHSNDADCRTRFHNHPS